MGLRQFLTETETQFDRIIGRTSEASRGLSDYSKQAAQAGADAERSVEKINGAVKLAQDGLTAAFATAQEMAKFQPVVQQFLDGFVQTEDVVRVLGPAVAGLLPSVGDVQARIRDMVADLEASPDKISAAMVILEQQGDRFAKMFVLLMKQFQAGQITIDQLIQKAQLFKEVLPDGSATEAVLDSLIHAGLQNRP